MTPSEARQLAQARRKEHGVRGSLARASNKVASLERLAVGVRRNKNGKYDGRSKLGKKLNRELPRARALEFRYQNELNEIQSGIAQLDELPRSRAGEWVEAEAARIVHRSMLPLIALVLTISILLEFPMAENWVWLTLVWLVASYTYKKIQQKSLMAKLQF